MEDFSNFFIRWSQDSVGKFFLAILILVVGWWAVSRLSKVLIMFLQKSNTDASMVSFLDSLLKVSLRFTLIVIVFGTLQLGVITTVLASLGGAALVALGLAFKDNLSNMISGVLLIINKPIHIGDYIKCGGSEGTVTKIEIMFTMLQTEGENKIIIIPNAHLITNAVTRSSDYNQINVVWKISFQLPEKMSEKQILKFFETELFLSQNISRVPAPEFKFQGLDGAIAFFEISVWCKKINSEKVQKDFEKLVSKLKSKWTINEITVT